MISPGKHSEPSEYGARMLYPISAIGNVARLIAHTHTHTDSHGNQEHSHLRRRVPEAQSAQEVRRELYRRHREDDPQQGVLDLAGLLTKAQGRELRRSVEKVREESSQRITRTVERFS